ncbi:pimeloyl-ACP methyl ester carboxylesterase [Paraburkholderia sp. BL6669N2]|uniref:alpha/beta fold hydrolase n=1 Tax=Paraburkholderia sp. BL6669N2 TaxID=1938807 RepID=UPI000E2535C3|nr:alpha/beta hydrolase [Paraburkholderia sp. BL6669N2]REG48629.1 pimeloyl-ACP methyl ester carboxylesterase [Paraburkholderia sp. BL6669N2]
MKSYILRLFAAFVASLCLVTLASVAACGSSSASTTGTVVLVHGAWADGSSWSSVTRVLQARGLKVVAVQLPRTSLADDAATVTRTIDAQQGPVLLVGHSYGGAVITQAGINNKVAGLVYVSAFAPGDNQSISDLTSPFPRPAWQAGLKADEAGFLTLNTDTYLSSFAPDLPKDTSSVLATAQAPLNARCLTDKVSQAAWKSKPSWWVYGDQDQIIPAALQQAEAKAVGAKITSIAGASHVALMSQPDAVAAVILDAARATGVL